MRQATCLKDEVRGRHEKEMYYFFQVLFNVFFKIYYLAGVISLWLCNWRLFAKKKSYKIYRSFKRSYIETYFTIIEIGISISLGIIPGIFFSVGFFCSTFVLDFVSLIFFPDVDDFSCGCFLFSCFFPFDILFLYILFSFENDSSLLFCCIAMLLNKTGNHFVH